ncbi:MAG: DUF1080 domain-containing protein [Armatimonadetes bacterium]|nr:DUF1080 domain-containing protein [Armatimonadota bacterium]MBS1710443.1 DUF1080 domain-containing protein [Armatimonadota bacterium]MBX3108114.1 DUF1080 domain-containing protein [Fimbriimonadaceae bacterium]
MIAALLLLGTQKDFKPIFNGKDLTGWTPKICKHPLGENFGDTFRVQDGKIVVGYSQYKAFDGQYGHLFYNTELRHFILRLEYRFVGEQCPGGAGWAYKNSGIMYLGQDPATMRIDQEFPVSAEFQFLGADAGQTRGTGNVCSPGTNFIKDGKLITPHVTEVNGPSIEGENWVKVELEVNGKEIIHRVNGKEVYRYEKLQYDPGDADAKELMKKNTLDIVKGTISLQSESHPCEFRNIELKKL